MDEWMDQLTLNKTSTWTKYRPNEHVPWRDKISTHQHTPEKVYSSISPYTKKVIDTTKRVCWVVQGSPKTWSCMYILHTRLVRNWEAMVSMLTCVCDQSLMNSIKCHNGANLCYSFTRRKMGAWQKGTVQVILGPSYHSGDHSNTMLGRWRLIQFAISFEADNEKGGSPPCNLRA